MKDKAITYATVFSGIGAPEQAWNPLGWKQMFASEIEPFPSAVLKHHHPDIPNYGDVTKYQEWPDHDIDVLIGGSPCQAFSVAGLRRSLDDDRGNLTLTFLGLAGKYRPRYIVWENVPGVLNTPDNAFGQFLAGLTGHDAELRPNGGRWRNAGFIVGPERVAAWAVKDAQFFGVPQRRRRVFVVASPRDRGFAPCQILFEPQGVRRDIEKGGKEGERVAGNVAIGIDEEVNARIEQFGPLLRGGQGGTRQAVATGFTPSSSGTVRAAGGDIGGGSETLVTEKWPAKIASCLDTTMMKYQGLDNQHVNANCPLFVPVSVNARQDPIVTEKAQPLDQKGNSQAVCFEPRSPDGVPRVRSDDKCPTLNTMSGGQREPCVCIQGAGATSQNSQGSGINEDVSFTLNNVDVHAVAFAQNTRDEVRLQGGDGQIVGALAAEPGMKQATYIKTDTIVRRLTPMECERLQGFPDGYTLIPGRGKSSKKGQWFDAMLVQLARRDSAVVTSPDGYFYTDLELLDRLARCPDGPRYKALGNSMAVPVIRWIGQRIELYESISRGQNVK
jgi:DNA (cytosine-5)-methyltransferase 1